MLTPIIVLLIGLLIFRKVYFYADPDIRDSRPSFDKEMFILVAIVAIFAGLLTGVLTSMAFPTVSVANDPVKLETMDISGPEIQGRFFLGSGYIDSEEYYVFRYYVPGMNNVLRDGKVYRYEPRYQVINLIRDQEADSAYYVTYHYEFAWDWAKWLAYSPMDTTPEIYDFHIPANAIVPQISIQK